MERSYKLEVLVFDKHKEFKWIGHLFFKGLFDGKRRLYLKDHGNKTTLVEQNEKSNEILVRLLDRMLRSETKGVSNLMNQKLK